MRGGNHEDWLTFAVELTKTLAWPATVFGSVLLLRAALLELIPTLRRLKYKDLELEFGKKLEDVVARAEQVKLPEATISEILPPPQPKPLQVDLELVARISPRGAVLEAYRRVEQAADQALSRAGVEPPRSPVARRQLLETKGIVTASTSGLLDDLRSLRNLAAHAEDFSLTPSQALEYAHLSQRLLGVFNVASSKLDR